MKWNYSLGWVLAFSVAALQTVSAATNYWQDVNTSVQARFIGDAASVNVMVKKGRRLTANLNEMKLGFAVGDNVAISLPLPDGSMTTYQFSRSSVMPDELAVKYPEIHTFKAFDINNPANRGSFDITPQGFHGMFKHNGKWVFIDPENRNDDGNYVAYYGTDAQPMENRPSDQVIDLGLVNEGFEARSPYSSRPIAGNTLRTYRLAMAAAAEYTAFHGSKALAIAAINTLVGRINAVYERDLAIRFELVANNDDIVYTNSLTDPYNNTDEDAETNKTSLPLVISNADFDIGHVVNTNGGGLAYLSGVCEDGNKAIGMTGASVPTGDAFYIEYVAHEIGHQLGANHTFNGTSGQCGRGPNRVATSAWEPGSGSTIMGYAGICTSQNLQVTSDAYFHSGSIQEILQTTGLASCGTVTAIQNNIPVADAGSDFTIPANLPFKLYGAGCDADGDDLSFAWEQYDVGPSSSGRSTMVDDGSRPLFRSREPSEVQERYLPNLVDYASGTLDIGETMPTTSRDLNFRLTVRDGKGGVATDEMTVAVVAGGNNFQITEPTTGGDLQPGETFVIRWDVAGTDQEPISCSTVDILISENGDENFDVIIAKDTPNDGVHSYTVSDTTTSDSVILLRCSSSGFYTLSSGGVVAAAGDDGLEIDMGSNGGLTNDSCFGGIPAAPGSPETGGGVDGDDSAGGSSDGGGSVSVNALLLCFGFILLAFFRRFRERKAV